MFDRPFLVKIFLDFFFFPSIFARAEKFFEKEFRFACSRNIRPIAILFSSRFLRIYRLFSFFFFFPSIFARAEGFFKREKKKRSWIGVKVVEAKWEERKVLEGLRLEEGGCWDGEVVSTSGP